MKPVRWTAAAVGLALAISACGAEAESSATTDAPTATKAAPPAPKPGAPSVVRRPTKPVRCPSAQVGAPKDGRFDARRILGRKLAAARTLAAKNHCTIRVIARDGEELPQTMDLRAERINVAVRDGVVVEIRGVG